MGPKPSVKSKNADRQSGYMPTRDAEEPHTGNKPQSTNEHTITGPLDVKNGPGTEPQPKVY